MAVVQIERGVGVIRAVVVDCNGVRHMVPMISDRTCLDSPIYPVDVRNAIQEWNASK